VPPANEGHGQGVTDQASAMRTVPDVTFLTSGLLYFLTLATSFITDAPCGAGYLSLSHRRWGMATHVRAIVGKSDPARQRRVARSWRGV